MLDIEARDVVVQQHDLIREQAREAELVAHGTVRHNALAAGEGGKLGNKRPTTPSGGFVEQILKWPLQAQFVNNLLAFKVLNISELDLDNWVGRAQIEHRMLNRISEYTWVFAIQI